ncbi:MAG: DUF2007 domain-containing protein [Bryobacteraceae bacterium]|nr:DUF2007 domain-containing protein [Bryobacteraceae bacterium]
MDLITVYRSADSNSESDASAIHRLLRENGILANLLDDSEAGVVSGSWEVRVNPTDAAEAERLIASTNLDDPGRPDPSPDLDAVTVAELQGPTGEIEALGIKSILDSEGIPNVMVGTSTLPVLSFLVKVPGTEVERAQRAIAEAQAAGPAAAVEAERESEGLSRT